MKLIVFPLIMLMTLALLSMMGLGVGGLNTEELSGFDNRNDYWYDANDHAVCLSNYSAVGEAGTFYQSRASFSQPLLSWWDNGTAPDYQLYTVTGAAERVDNTAIGWDATSALGLIGIIIGVMVLATVVGLKVFGTGTTEAHTIVVGAAFLALWAVFSVLGMNLVLQIPYLGVVFYFFLTALYTIGIIGQISSGGDGL